MNLDQKIRIRIQANNPGPGRMIKKYQGCLKIVSFKKLNFLHILLG